MSCGESKVVCVTGASGFIASWLVKLLLQRGYTVKATVRDPNDQKKTEHLLSLDGAKERLHLFKADLLAEASFDPVVDGCEGVFHTASPALLSSTNPQAELIEPALKGTLNVLGSCVKVQSIKRVVITSSMAAVGFNGKPLAADVIIDESWFSDPAFCEKTKLWYMLSKTLAEEAAWKFAKEKGIDIITINPGWVIGPLLQPTLNLSVELVLKLVNGTEKFPNKTYRLVDVRDVANAHILAFENPSATGRYCLVGSVKHCSEIVKMLYEISPALNLPDKCADDKPFTPTYQVSKERTQTLGVKYTPLEVSLKDTIESLKNKNFF
ncbi:putative cinnamyl-alcohol dehydrogenase [Rosa chinensis]|uniref:Putative cinnamyl-alcohol dehydrogenase n=1 Tax=Rosa chinensis TaxID=74649 RepID=A0A2P6S7Y2_ROSCH|nr:phenylacetaldehyde reductase [Rosa chinensis]PRQ54797.1 putative cinnamyl-alcohol dehydrogenase [Rosa chinensis]